MSIERLILSAALALACVVPACAAEPAKPAPPVVKLWPDGAPGSEQRRNEPERLVDGAYPTNVHDPSLTVLRADPRHANGAAVVIAPGGGHYLLVMENEGLLPARMLNRIGVTAFVLKYRLAHGPDSAGYSVARDGAADLRRAVRWVRAHAAEYAVDPQRVGVMGFSAGGELVSLVADNPEPPQRGTPDAVDRLSARPDFQVLVYPGDAGTPAQAADKAPPAFLVAGSRDACCLAPSLTLYQQLVKAGVSAELHLYADTDHAFNMGQRGERVSLQHWPDRLSDWLSDGGWLVPRNGRKPEGVPAP
ncbi:alpha/beta hydrolase [Massilia sp. TW-1]|uniref:Alpha/beta hydrolase n=1 Tax=Telluria antibiotica TaxID=2717319 RepID=A0ABX0PJP0_9BURK|nr:alpha/beta hydrolase [Telluria antibiotica]NIA57666.1 alpha/beta hydrolase [Telluria antibiotica]